MDGCGRQCPRTMINKNTSSGGKKRVAMERLCSGMS